MPHGLSITGYSTALFSTWYFIEEYGILFDCGDGLCSGLLQKARKIKHCFISHADRDHLAGLLQFHQLNGRDGLAIHYPRDSGSFPALATFTANFDPQVSGTRWIGLAPESETSLRDDLLVRAIENRHIATDGQQTKSLTYVIESTSRKLKAEYIGMVGPEIAKQRKENGVDTITEERRTIELIYSGDTPLEDDGRYNDAKILIHEATFLTREEMVSNVERRIKHSALDEVMEMVADSNIKTLILGHFSSRYSDEQIDAAIEREKARFGITIPVLRTLPGRITRFN